MAELKRIRGLMREWEWKPEDIARCSRGKWANTCDVIGCGQWGKWNSCRVAPSAYGHDTRLIFLICEEHIKEDLKIST